MITEIYFTDDIESVKTQKMESSYTFSYDLKKIFVHQDNSLPCKLSSESFDTFNNKLKIFSKIVFMKLFQADAISYVL